jgi:NADH-quinone oxidoreductase subunit N
LNSEITNILFNFLPEITLAICIIILNLSAVKPEFENKFRKFITIAGFGIAVFASVIQVYFAPQLLFGGSIIADHFSYGARLIILSFYLLLVISERREYSDKDTTVLLSAIGAVMAVSSANMVMMFVSIEIMYYSLFIAMPWEIRIKLKYFIYSACTSALSLFGISLVYGISGSMDYSTASLSLSHAGINTPVVNIAIILIAGSMIFKAGMPGFNFSLPLAANDSSYSQTGYTIIAAALASLFTLVRFLFTVLYDRNAFVQIAGTYSFIEGVNWQLLIAVSSLAAIVTGNFVLLRQYDLRRIIFFLAISQLGYSLISVCYSQPEGITSFVLNSVLFVINTAGLIFIFNMAIKKLKIQKIDDIKSLASKSPFMAAAISVFLCSIAGIPFTSGFIGKLALLTKLANGGHSWLAAISIISLTPLLIFGFRIIRLMYIKDASNVKNKLGTLDTIILLILLFSTIVPGILFSPLYNWAKYCSIYLLY